MRTKISADEKAARAAALAHARSFTAPSCIHNAIILHDGKWYCQMCREPIEMAFAQAGLNATPARQMLDQIAHYVDPPLVDGVWTGDIAQAVKATIDGLRNQLVKAIPSRSRVAAILLKMNAPESWNASMEWAADMVTRAKDQEHMLDCEGHMYGCTRCHIDHAFACADALTDEQGAEKC